MQSSSNPIRAFGMTKINHRRDFLRENKLNLRELQKNTTQKLTQQKIEQERQDTKHLLRYQRSQEQFASRRSNSQQPINIDDLRQKAHGSDRGGQSNRVSYGRSNSRQRHENLQPAHPAAGYDGYKNNLHSDVKDLRVPRSASVASIVSKAESCDKEIQTEDIIDEEFLYDALKKCSFTEIANRNNQIAKEYEDNDNYPVSAYNLNLQSQHAEYNDNKSTHSREHVQYDDYGDHKAGGDNGNYQQQYTEEYNHMPHSGLSEEGNHLEEQMHDMRINIAQAPRENEAQSSARGRQTLVSNGSKKKSQGTNKLGNREDVRLPRYLEKEKRIKEVERKRELARDPNCQLPLGHYALAEQERLAALGAAQKRMGSLIQELNHMPITSETLRVRSRKMEIENEIRQIELDLQGTDKFGNREVNRQGTDKFGNREVNRQGTDKFGNREVNRQGTDKFGNREDLRLPRNLEKEKRIKEVERKRESASDTDCPLGHYALAEEETLAALGVAQKKMGSLIQELNHMPITSETLRIRSRKMEIENEIRQIELDIHAFSKPKVT